MFRSLTIALLVSILAPTLAHAQQAASPETTAPEPPAPAPAGTPPETKRVAPLPEPGFALTLAAGARMGAIQGEDGPIGVVGPLGGIDLMIGHQLAVLDEAGSSIALVYHGSIFGGVDQPLRSPQAMIEHRHGIGLQMRVRAFAPGLSTGAIVAHLPEIGATVPGWFLTAHLAFAAGPVYIGVPFSLDVYVGTNATMVVQSIGLSIGGTTM